MVSLVNDIATVRKYLRVSSLNSNVMLPDFEGAQKKHIVPILGKELYNTIEIEAIANPATPTELLKLVLRAVVPLGYFAEIAFVSAQITDMGVGTISSEHFVTAPRWLYLQLQENLQNKGCAALEDLLSFLYNDRPEGMAWEIPEEFNCLIKTGKEFSQLFNIYQPYRTFESLRPLVKKSEDEKIRPLIGDVFFEYLRDIASPSADEKEVILLAKKAIAYWTIKNACELLPVRVGAEGFTVTLTHNVDSTSQGQQQAPAVQMSVLVNSCETSGNSYLSTLIDVLNKKASEVVFPLFFNSTYYSPAVIETPVASGVLTGGYMEDKWRRDQEWKDGHNSEHSTFVL